MADYHDEAERQRDIASRATEWVDEATKFLQNRAVSPLFWIARAIIFGLLGLALVVVAGVLAVDTLVKLLDAYLFAGRVWITYLSSEALHCWSHSLPGRGWVSIVCQQPTPLRSQDRVGIMRSVDWLWISGPELNVEC